jgi:hypothetical protein
MISLMILITMVIPSIIHIIHEYKLKLVVHLPLRIDVNRLLNQFVEIISSLQFG